MEVPASIVPLADTLPEEAAILPVVEVIPVPAVTVVAAVTEVNTPAPPLATRSVQFARLLTIDVNIYGVFVVVYIHI
jgi:hypothetical protein